MSSLQERTLVVKGYDPNKTTKEILEELFIQGGPVRNIVFRPDHSFVEFEDKESVGFALALFRGLELFGQPLVIEPKLNESSYFKYIHDLDLVYNQLMVERNLVSNIQHTVTPRPMLFNQQQSSSHFANHHLVDQQHQSMIFERNIQQSFPVAPSNFRGPSGEVGGGILPLNPSQVFYPEPSRVPQMNANYNDFRTNEWINHRSRENDSRRDFVTYRNPRDDNDEDEAPATSRFRDRSRSPIHSNRNYHHNRDYNNRHRDHGGNNSNRYDRGRNVRGKGSYNKRKR